MQAEGICCSGCGGWGWSGSGSRDCGIHLHPGGGEVALHVLAHLLDRRDRLGCGGGIICIAVHNAEDELRSLTAEGIVQLHAHTRSDILPGQDAAVFLRGTPIGIHRAARQDGEGLEFEAVTDPARFMDDLGWFPVRGVAVQNLLPHFRRELRGDFAPGRKLAGEQFREAVVVDDIREDAEHRLGFSKNIARRIVGRTDA